MGRDDGRSALLRSVHGLVRGEEIDASAMEGAMGEILSGRADPLVVSAFLTVLAARGETVTQISAAAKTLRDHGMRVDVNTDGVLLDTCGTGGDGLGSFNVSTAVALVVAACGVSVVKHGNRAVSSRSGSADLLEALGVTVDLGPAAVARCVREVGIGFFYAPLFHGALRSVGPVRRALRLRTLFNLLGPLANPARASHQLVGVYARDRVQPFAEVLAKLGLHFAWVVHGEGGLDEISPAGPSLVAQWDGQGVRTFEVNPGDFGLPVQSLQSVAGGDATENGRIMGALMDGDPVPQRNTVLMNAAAALLVAGRTPDLRDGVKQAAFALDDGRARMLVERWSKLSGELKAHGSSRD